MRAHQPITIQIDYHSNRLPPKPITFLPDDCRLTTNIKINIPKNLTRIHKLFRFVLPIKINTLIRRVMTLKIVTPRAS